jgi:hypothetical protein
MELFFIFAAVVTLDIAALELLVGDTRSHPLAHHERALEALKHGDFDAYREEIGRLERDIARAPWRMF